MINGSVWASVEIPIVLAGRVTSIGLGDGKSEQEVLVASIQLFVGAPSELRETAYRKIQEEA